MKKRTLLVLLIVGFSAQLATAQQDPQYTQYIYNMNVINPAYAGNKEALSLTALYRNQWSGFDGAPETATFSGHSPVGKNVGLGLSVISDELGPVNETNAYADFSYTLQLGTKTKLALGLKAGATFLDIGLTDLDLQDEGDQLFSENVNTTKPNFGAGLFLYTDNFFFGLSVPNFLTTTHLDENALDFGSEERHYFATAGYVFQINDNFKLKPSALVKSEFNSPVSFDVNLNALFFDKFEIGGSYRLDDSFSGLVGFQATPVLRIGYAYDAVTSEIRVVAPSSHEVILTYDLIFNKKALRSPRYF